MVLNYATVLLGLFWAVLAAVSLRDRNLITPSKTFLLHAVLYLGDIYYNEYSSYVYSCCAAYLGMIAFLLYVEAELVRNKSEKVKRIHRTFASPSPADPASPYVYSGRAHLVIWLLSIVPTALQVYLVQKGGGLFFYVGNMGGRVVEVAGWGPMLVLLRMMPILSFVYSCVIFTTPNSRLIEKMSYALHLALACSLGMLSASRTSTFIPIVLALFAYNFARERLSLTALLVAVVGMYVGAAALGATREYIKIDGNELILAKAEGASNFRWSSFTYGLSGVATVDEVQEPNLKYGKTYLTALTNFVPRTWWPGKPDTGGVIFTKEYLGDMWQGYSIATPGIFGEAAMNFGRLGGVVATLVLLGVGFMWSAQLYRRVMLFAAVDVRSPALTRAVVFYTLQVLYVAGLLVGEFANTTVQYILSVFFAHVTFQVLERSAVVKGPGAGLFASRAPAIRGTMSAIAAAASRSWELRGR